MKNNKGFSLIEILGVVVILGILSLIGVAAYSKYLESSRQQAYDTMAKSAASAANQYVMDHPETTTVTFDELVEGDYLEYPVDPRVKDKACYGKVVIVPQEAINSKEIDSEKYDVTVCCATYSYTYHFPKGNKENGICE